MKKVTIHQPEHLPWLGFFHKINLADVYAVLDNVQFRKDYFQNRNQIRTAEGKAWINVPVKERNKIQLIRDVRISYDHKWIPRYLGLIQQNYIKSKFFDKYFPGLESIIKREYANLWELNLELIKFILESLNIKKRIVIASDLNLPPSKGGTMVNWNICKTLGADLYISGISGREYLDEAIFRKDNIKIEYQEFHHPIYEQVFNPFFARMSTIDLLFNYGQRSLEVINGNGVAIMEEVFS